MGRMVIASKAIGVLLKHVHCFYNCEESEGVTTYKPTSHEYHRWYKSYLHNVFDDMIIPLIAHRNIFINAAYSSVCNSFVRSGIMYVYSSS